MTSTVPQPVWPRPTWEAPKLDAGGSFLKLPSNTAVRLVSATGYDPPRTPQPSDICGLRSTNQPQQKVKLWLAGHQFEGEMPWAGRAKQCAVVGMGRARSSPLRALISRPVVLGALLVLILLGAALVLWRGQHSTRPSGQVNCGVGGSNQPWVANCLLDAYAKDRGANGTLSYSTLEGDSVSVGITVISQSTIRVVVDNRDRYGQPGLYSYLCSGMTRSDTRQDPYQLSLRGCTGNGPVGPGATLNVPSWSSSDQSRGTLTQRTTLSAHKRMVQERGEELTVSTASIAVMKIGRERGSDSIVRLVSPRAMTLSQSLGCDVPCHKAGPTKRI
jgi:hypothetical protein